MQIDISLREFHLKHLPGSVILCGGHPSRRLPRLSEKAVKLFEVIAI